MKATSLLLIGMPLLVHALTASCAERISYPGSPPGPAIVTVGDKTVAMRNHVLRAEWNLRGVGIGPISVADGRNREANSLGPAGELFEIILADGTTYPASALRRAGDPRATARPLSSNASRRAARTAGQQVEIPFLSDDGRLRIVWRALLLDEANYVRQEIEVTASQDAVTIRDIVWLNEHIPGATNAGSVDGSLVVSEPFFLGCEDPMARNQVVLPEREIGSWSPADFKTGRRQRKTWLLDRKLLTGSPLTLLFRYDRGSHRLDVHQVALLEDGREIARDRHHGHTGTAHVNNAYVLEVPIWNASARYEVQTDLDTDPNFELAAGRTVDSWGHLLLVGGEGDSVCRMRRDAQLARSNTLTQSFVIGIFPEGQLRRAFLYYLERERAHPYRPFLHYNSWYDTAWKPFALNEENCLEAIQLFGERFINTHNVKLDALVFDDGWDDPKSLWRFHDGFPGGFAPLAAMCRTYDTRLGVWLSPFGGYGKPREQRLKYGRQQGYETNAVGFSMAGPKYYAAFKRSCVEMIRKYGVNHFKFDGIAKGMHAQGGGEYILDTEAMRRLMLELREEDPDLYINLTTGSWPSPFWLRYADSVWRQGHDMGFAGPGSKQQQWLTYRDQETYRNIVRRGPLYPLNSLMTQGIAYSRQGYAGDPTFTSAGFRDDVRAFFGSGTGLQELYIQPGRLTKDDWSTLAEAAKWSRSSADVLVDTHWIGGDPSEADVYGFASWAPRKGIVMLRNPDKRTQSFRLDVRNVFELPKGSPTVYELKSPWKEDTDKSAITAAAGEPIVIDLDPFEVLVFDAVPAK